ncbi:Protein-L-isoaspartate O-methyltransferase [hydrothermal vent metagenome]|uniref:Protein-L-isoaspartate O-methyltransferase n=1 Tax=hydrothermal vent metagenome TaxID=652676 RepID=A0A3B0RB76_9ZZZZ
MDFSIARQNMVESQIRPNGITDLSLISALGQVERENFSRDINRSIAYLDEDLPIGNGRFLLQPMVLGRLLQLAEIKPVDLVLDIGPGTGYSTAVIAQLAESVVGIEQDKELCEMAGETLLELRVTNAAIICGEHVNGVPSEAPFDVIVINGQITEIPSSLLDQLADGGRLVAVLGPEKQGKITLVKKQGDKLSTWAAFDASAPFLTGFEAKTAHFQF